jgi:hypothetical protein
MGVGVEHSAWKVTSAVLCPPAYVPDLLARAQPFEQDPPSVDGTCGRCGYRGCVYPGRYGARRRRVPSLAIPEPRSMLPETPRTLLATSPEFDGRLSERRHSAGAASRYRLLVKAFTWAQCGAPIAFLHRRSKTGAVRNGREACARGARRPALARARFPETIL